MSSISFRVFRLFHVFRVLSGTWSKAQPQNRLHEEVWAHRLMRIHFGNCIRVGDFVYGSSGGFGPAPFTAINIKTGKTLYIRDRGKIMALDLSPGRSAEDSGLLPPQDSGLYRLGN